MADRLRRWLAAARDRIFSNHGFKDLAKPSRALNRHAQPRLHLDVGKGLSITHDRANGQIQITVQGTAFGDEVDSDGLNQTRVFDLHDDIVDTDSGNVTQFSIPPNTCGAPSAVSPLLRNTYGFPLNPNRPYQRDAT